MYLRRVMFSDGCHYVIRESYCEAGLWKHKDLADLGVNPGECIEYTGGNGFYFQGDFEEKLRAGGAHYSSEDLERLFVPFLKPHIRRIIENFQAHTTRSHGVVRPSGREAAEKQRRLHSFDKRRLHFLRCGRVDIGELDGRSWRFLDVLVDKSRDEIEHILEGMECVLRPHEMRLYLFSALHLQTHFPHHALRNHPDALDQETVDNCFLAALCCLNHDVAFWAGMEGCERSTLHPCLIKYVILYFDSDFGQPYWPEYLRERIGRWRAYPRVPAVDRMGLDDACRVFGVTREEGSKMTGKELVRMYRRKAKELHPDRGGDKESFIRLGEAFACLTDIVRS